MVTTLDRPTATDEDTIHPLLTPALAHLAERAAVAQVYLDYYAGLQRPVLPPERVNTALGRLLARYHTNLSAAVVDAVADRLAVIGVAPQRGEDDQAAADAWALWQLNRMDRRAGDVLLSALTAGDAYLVIWPDLAGIPRIAWTPATMMTAGYDGEQPDRLAWAIKAWSVTSWEDGPAVTRWRVNLYLPDAIRKYVGEPWPRNQAPTEAPPLPEKADSLRPFQVTDEPWPLPNPIAPVLPVAHLANNAGEGSQGRSELADVLPLQDALNTTVANILTSNEYVAYPQRHVTGLALERDDKGNPINPFKPGASRLWVAEDPAVSFGEFPAADLVQLMQTADMFRRDISRVSGVPSHYLGLDAGGWPSGEAQKTAEARLVAKIADRQNAFATGFEQALNIARRFSGREPAALDLQWASAETRDATAETARRQEILAICTSPASRGARAIMLQEEGYSADQIDALLGPEQAPLDSSPV
jgi:hypothetical protein